MIPYILTIIYYVCMVLREIKIVIGSIHSIYVYYIVSIQFKRRVHGTYIYIRSFACVCIVYMYTVVHEKLECISL